MSFRLFIIFMSFLIYGGIYALYKQQTIGSLCRGLGTDIAAYGGTAQIFGTVGNAINDTCSGR